MSIRLPIVFGPLHIAFLEMVIDPLCSLVFEAESEEDNVMDRPPRDPQQALFSRSLMAWSFAQGALALMMVASVYLVSLHFGIAENEVRALTFISLIVSIVGLVLVDRTFDASAGLRRRNRAFVAVVAIDLALLGLVFAFPPATALFQVGLPNLAHLSAVLAAAIVLVVSLQGLKLFWRKQLSA